MRSSDQTQLYMRSPTRIFHLVKIIFLVALSTLSQSKGSADPVSNEIVRFPDPQLEAAIREALDIPTGDITSTDLLLLTHFSAWNEQIEDITGIEYATNLTTLDLYRNQIPDLSPLAQLTKLTELKLNGNNALENLDFLRSLPALAYLDLTGVGSASQTSPNFEVLNELTQLTYLNLEFSGISELSPLENLANLVELDLSRTYIKNLNPLQELANLTQLNLEYTAIEDFTPLKGIVNLNSLKVSFSSWLQSNKTIAFNSLTDALTHLSKLETLEIHSLQIEGVSQIANAIPNIKSLHIYNSAISDITALSSLTNLSSLSLEDNEIADISSLANLTNLLTLNIEDNWIQDISPLANLTNLSELSFGRSEKSYSIDISPLSNLANLTSLSLTNASDITPILNFSGLTSLSIGYSQVLSLEPLTGFTHLKSLSVYNSFLKDITALAQLPQLESLNISRNSISDISAISTQPNLRFLYIQNNYISDLTPVFQLDQLRLLLCGYNLVRLEEGTPQRLALDAYIEKYPYLFFSTQYQQQKVSLTPNNTVTSASQIYTINSFFRDSHAGFGISEGIPNPVSTNDNNWVSINLISQELAYNSRGIFLGYNYDFEIEIEENLGSQPRSASVYVFGEPHTIIQNGNETPVVFQDQNLISALREILNKPNGDILEKDINGLTTLDLSNRGITNLSGLETAVNLTSLNLSSNKITTLEPLSTLSNLVNLNLFENKIDDIGPIAELLKLQHLDISYNKINYEASWTKKDLEALESIEGITIIKFPEDSDSDGLYDFLENRIIDADPNDNFNSLADVTKYDDFDHDGYSNYNEQGNQSDPSDFASPRITLNTEIHSKLTLSSDQNKPTLEMNISSKGYYRVGISNTLTGNFKGIEITPGDFVYWKADENPEPIKIDLENLNENDSLFIIVRPTSLF